jgi:hypothetical protein
MEGWLTNVTFFPSISIFRSLHLCSCFSLLVFSLFFFYFSCPRCLSLFLFLLVSLCIIYISSFFVCVFLYYLFVVFPFFVCSSWFLWVCICWLDQQPAMRGSWSSLLLEKGHKSLCLLYVFFYVFFCWPESIHLIHDPITWPDRVSKLWSIYENLAFLLEKKCFNKLQIKRINYDDIWHYDLTVFLKINEFFYFFIMYWYQK